MSHPIAVNGQGAPRTLVPAVTPDSHLINIDGYLLDLPADPVEGFNYIRTLVISSYRAVTAGTSTLKERAITFGIASTELHWVRLEPGGEEPVVVKQEPDTTPVRTPCHTPSEGRKGTDEVMAAVHSAESIKSRKRKFHYACKELEQNRLNQMGSNTGLIKDGFLGDYRDIGTAIAKIKMPAGWVIGRYFEGMITLRGENADTRVLRGEQSCKRCIYTGSICKILFACDDPLLMARKCSRCYAKPGLVCEFV